MSHKPSKTIVDNLLWLVNNKVYNTLTPTEKEIIMEAADKLEEQERLIKRYEQYNFLYSDDEPRDGLSKPY